MQITWSFTVIIMIVLLELAVYLIISIHDSNFKLAYSSSASNSGG